MVDRFRHNINQCCTRLSRVQVYDKAKNTREPTMFCGTWNLIWKLYNRKYRKYARQSGAAGSRQWVAITFLFMELGVKISFSCKILVWRCKLRHSSGNFTYLKINYLVNSKSHLLMCPEFCYMGTFWKNLLTAVVLVGLLCSLLDSRFKPHSCMWPNSQSLTGCSRQWKGLSFSGIGITLCRSQLYPPVNNYRMKLATAWAIEKFYISRKIKSPNL